MRYEQPRRARLKIKGLPRIDVKDERLPYQRQPLQIHISRRPVGGVYVYMVFDHIEDADLRECRKPVGINLGRSGVRWALSNGIVEERRRKNDADIKRLQRKMARQSKGSKSRLKTIKKLRRLSEKENIRNRNYLHQLTASLIRDHDGFAVEDISISDMISGRDNPSDMNASILQQNWAEFLAMLEYKAKECGYPFVRVDPAYTTTTCSQCGTEHPDMTEKEKRRSLFTCSKCGVHRKPHSTAVNAAVNIFTRNPTPFLGRLPRPPLVEEAAPMG